MATYYGLTTLNAQMSGWRIVAMGDSKDAARTEAEAAVERDNPRDSLELDTERKNLRVVSKTTARRSFGITEYDEDAYYDGLAYYAALAGEQ